MGTSEGGTVAHRTYMIWYDKPETVSYPIVIAEDGIVVANVYTKLAYQDQPENAKIMSRDEHWLPYDERNVNEKAWKPLSRCEVRKFMRKHYPTFDTKLL